MKTLISESKNRKVLRNSNKQKIIIIKENKMKTKKVSKANKMKTTTFK